MSATRQKAITAGKKAIQKTKKTVFWILKIILPISFLVSFLQFWGVIDYLSTLLTPFLILIGLPGEAAIVFISSIFLPLYAPIAIIATLNLPLREITLLALMCLISHNLLVETAVQRKTGTSAAFIVVLRITASFLAAFILNHLLPAEMDSKIAVTTTVSSVTTVADVLLNWVKMALTISIKIIVIITALMFIQSFLKEFNWIDKLKKPFAPVMKFMGLSPDVSLLWIIAQIAGLTYGSALILEEMEGKSLQQREVNLLNYHIALNHSLLEDTFLFVAIGVPILWLIIPRLILAMIVVWTARQIDALKKRLPQTKQP